MQHHLPTNCRQRIYPNIAHWNHLLPFYFYIYLSIILYNFKYVSMIHIKYNKTVILFYEEYNFSTNSKSYSACLRPKAYYKQAKAGHSVLKEF